MGDICGRQRQGLSSLCDAPEVVIIPQTTQLFEKALKGYRDMTDKSWSLTSVPSKSLQSRVNEVNASPISPPISPDE
jgi:hypothetical protein